MFNWILVILACLSESKSSLVIDSLSQKDPHVAQYCPKTPYCQEGAHVMCMYYNPNSVMGPRCSNPQNMSMTPDIAAKLLEVSNADPQYTVLYNSSNTCFAPTRSIFRYPLVASVHHLLTVFNNLRIDGAACISVRSRIALGKETGQNGPLPRGYGIFRLSWDEELATFAQVLANQCVLARDLCRATKKFPDPGQATGLVRFTYPDWLPVSNKSHFIKSSLTPPKLNYAITQTMKTWYGQKNYVTPEMVLNYPDFLNQKSQLGKLYLKMIYGPATHMGCGLSAYTQFAYYDNNSPLNYNVVQVVCNYSARPGKGLQVYTTTPPTQIGYTVKCGCPEGYDEDADCLCFESPKQVGPPPAEQNFCSDDSCKQSVVLLPIFTVEDAPPEKLLPPSFQNKSHRIREYEIFHPTGNYKMNRQTLDPQNLNEFSQLLRGPDTLRYPQQSKPSSTLGRYEDRKLGNKRLRYNKSDLPTLSHVPRKHGTRPSIFSRAQTFKLPTRKMFSSYQLGGKEIKKDVAPRKDFSSVQKLLKTYLNKKRNHVGNMFKGKNYEYTSNEPLKSKEIDVHVTDNDTITKSKVTNLNRFLNSKQALVYGDFNTTSEFKDLDMPNLNENSDKKLMALLNNLEIEVKHTELDPADKEIFDSRIRKIYDTVVGKHNRQLKTIQLLTNDKRRDEEINDNLIHFETAVDDELLNKKRFMSEAPEDHTTGLVKRNQNSIRSADKHYRNVYTDYKNYDGNNKKHLKEIDRYDIGNISYERRKYYQDKLDNLQKKLQSARAHRRTIIDSPRHVMPVRPTKISSNERQLRPTNPKSMDTFYIPDRARFIHGF